MENLRSENKELKEKLGNLEKALEKMTEEMEKSRLDFQKMIEEEKAEKQELRRLLQSLESKLEKDGQNPGPSGEMEVEQVNSSSGTEDPSSKEENLLNDDGTFKRSKKEIKKLRKAKEAEMKRQQRETEGRRIREENKKNKQKREEERKPRIPPIHIENPVLWTRIIDGIKREKINIKPVENNAKLKQ